MKRINCLPSPLKIRIKGLEVKQGKNDFTKDFFVKSGITLRSPTNTSDKDLSNTALKQSILFGSRGIVWYCAAFYFICTKKLPPMQDSKINVLSIVKHQL